VLVHNGQGLLHDSEEALDGELPGGGAGTRVLEGEGHAHGLEDRREGGVLDDGVVAGGVVVEGGHDGEGFLAEGHKVDGDGLGGLDVAV